MRKPTPKTTLLLSATAVFFFISYSCSKQKLSSLEVSKTPRTTQSVNSTPREVNPFKKTTGAPINVQIGNKWIENFNSSNRNTGKSYVIQSKDLQAILNNPICVGICLYFAIDADKSAHILPIGVNENGRLMKTRYINTQKGLIDWETAQKWIANDPSPIDARFFGRNTFIRLFSDPTCLAIRAVSALDEQKNPQLLLGNAAVNYKNINSLNLRMMRYEDESAICPPVCPLVDHQ